MKFYEGQRVRNTKTQEICTIHRVAPASSWQFGGVILRHDDMMELSPRSIVTGDQLDEWTPIEA